MPRWMQQLKIEEQRRAARMLDLKARESDLIAEGEILKANLDRANAAYEAAEKKLYE